MGADTVMGVQGLKRAKQKAAEPSEREGPGRFSTVLTLHVLMSYKMEWGRGRELTQWKTPQMLQPDVTSHTLLHPLLPPCMLQALPQSTYSVTALSVHSHVCRGPPAMCHHGCGLPVFWPQVQKFLTGGLRVGAE